MFGLSRGLYVNKVFIPDTTCKIQCQLCMIFSNWKIYVNNPYLSNRATYRCPNCKGIPIDVDAVAPFLRVHRGIIEELEC